ncbi:MAG: tRNA pseudouridine(13) synthase TruD [Bacteroidales bacterium]|nr:tRNA pseudouridine(13) synthase TruD [Bacteroidales bacterium]
MKLKQIPADFQVEELTETIPGESGPFALYRLHKIGWTTPDAIFALRRRWQIDAHRVSYGGLKDRHAETSQYLTISHGPKRGLEYQRVRLTYLGQVAEPFTSQAILANRFTITLRALSISAVRAALGRVDAIRTCGVPNYFDDQRFGSVSAEGQFVARHMVQGEFALALQLALTAPYAHDRADQKREKALLRQHWGDWVHLKAQLPRGHARSLVDYLTHRPTDFRGAVARLRPELQGLYLSAYQSDIWNRTLARWLERRLPPTALLELDLHHRSLPVPVSFPEPLLADWQTRSIPLPSARLRPDPDADWLPILQEVLAEDGLTYDRMKIPGLQKPFFSKGERAIGFIPANWTQETAPDELHKNQQKITLRFDLPRGCYATMLIKRLTAVRRRAGDVSPLPMTGE